MGAEFLVVLTEVPTPETATTEKTELEGLSDQRVEEVWYELADWTYMPEESVGFIEKMRHDLLDILTAGQETAIAETREVAHCVIKGLHLAVTGGMSWGDDPNDSYNIIQQYAMLRDLL